MKDVLVTRFPRLVTVKIAVRQWLRRRRPPRRPDTRASQAVQFERGSHDYTTMLGALPQPVHRVKLVYLIVELRSPDIAASCGAQVDQP